MNFASFLNFPFWGHFGFFFLLFGSFFLLLPPFSVFWTLRAFIPPLPPCMQSLNNSVLESWTKGFATGHDTDDPVVGKDVVPLLAAAFARQGLGLECEAVVNDTVRV